MLELVFGLQSKERMKRKIKANIPQSIKKSSFKKRKQQESRTITKQKDRRKKYR